MDSKYKDVPPMVVRVNVAGNTSDNWALGSSPHAPVPRKSRRSRERTRFTRVLVSFCLLTFHTKTCEKIKVNGFYIRTSLRWTKVLGLQGQFGGVSTRVIYLIANLTHGFKIFITSFGSIALFCGTDNIPRSIFIYSYISHI